MPLAAHRQTTTTSDAQNLRRIGEGGRYLFRPPAAVDVTCSDGRSPAQLQRMWVRVRSLDLAQFVPQTWIWCMRNAALKGSSSSILVSREAHRGAELLKRLDIDIREALQKKRGRSYASQKLCSIDPASTQSN